MTRAGMNKRGSATPAAHTSEETQPSLARRLCRFGPAKPGGVGRKPRRATPPEGPSPTLLTRIHQSWARGPWARPRTRGRGQTGAKTHEQAGHNKRTDREGRGGVDAGLASTAPAERVDARIGSPGPRPKESAYRDKHDWLLQRPVPAYRVIEARR